jgi:hypothetical protein
VSAVLAPPSEINDVPYQLLFFFLALISFMVCVCVYVCVCVRACIHSGSSSSKLLLALVSTTILASRSHRTHDLLFCLTTLGGRATNYSGHSLRLCDCFLYLIFIHFATETGYDREAGVRLPAEAKFSLLHSIQAGSGAHPAS